MSEKVFSTLPEIIAKLRQLDSELDEAIAYQDKMKLIRLNWTFSKLLGELEDRLDTIQRGVALMADDLKFPKEK